MSDAHAVEATGVSKAFRGRTIFADVSVRVRFGSCLALLGRNGAGKSTLLRCVGGVLTPDAGTATVCGYDLMRQQPEARACIGLHLGEERSWYWRLSGRGNLNFFAASVGLDRPSRRRRVSELLDEVGLDTDADRWVGEYSTGMRARLGLARALLREPPVLILDEPTRSLDPEAREWFRSTLRRQLAAGVAIVLATHDEELVAGVGAETLMMGGSATADGDGGTQ